MNINNSGGTKTIREMVASDLAKFDPNKLLEMLTTIRKRGLGPPTFDVEDLRRDVTHLAEWYFWRENTKRKTIPNAVRAKQLSQLARALGRACAVAKADDIVDDLWMAIHGAADGPLTTGAVPKIASASVSRSLRVVNRSVAGLVILEKAARTANAHRRGGRPKGTSALPPEYFRSSTGTKPGAGEGPFARFVGEFLAAVGRAIAYSAVPDIIKDARALSLQQPTGWPPSPFK